jgi:2-dehydro-3-deoxyphosphogluconate aldolase/(4S)-4-hydroxy-2-oxoglutarate aldolase
MVSPILAALTEHRLLAIIRGHDEDATVVSARTLITSGVSMLEISLSGSGALSAIARISAEAGPQVWVGAGTVLTVQQAHDAHEAGARFLVTPGMCPAVAEAGRMGLGVLAGALTPTEVIAAAERADAVKLFPASLGGPGYLQALRAPFPEVPFVPVGGVDAQGAKMYLAAGAVGVGIGSPLIGDAADGGDQSELAARAVSLLQVVTP